MNAGDVKQALRQLHDTIPQKLDPSGWYLTDRMPPHALMPDKDRWTCMFAFMERLMAGHAICFSEESPGCSGASCYLGFKEPSPEAGRFLAEKEGFKKSADLGKAFYAEIPAPSEKPRFVVWQSLSGIPDAVEIVVINLWVNAAGLSDLVTLANYDRPDNVNVRLPFASGCQSIWTLPFHEKEAVNPKCVAGCMDPAMRQYLPSDTLSFSAPAKRFVDMSANIPGSFLAH